MEDSASEARQSILVVDDEPGVLEMFSALLSVSGYKVHTASSGQAALDFLHRRLREASPGEAPVDLVILDVLMPHMNGREVCRRIKSHPMLKYIPVLMVTALGSLQDQITGIETGADDYVNKPFRSEELLIHIRALMRIGQVQQELLGRNIELRALRNFNESILQNMGNGLLTVDRELTVTTLNQAAVALLNCSMAEWMGKSLSSVPQSCAPLRQIIEGTLQDEKPYPYQEISIATDGVTIPLRVSTTLLRDEEDGVSGVICILEDLREIKAMEAEQRRLDRLAMSGEMAASVAHEIRNPLVTLSLGFQYLQKSLGPDSQHQEAIQRLERQVDRLAQIVNEFLAFSRPPKLNPVLCDVTEVLDRAMEISEQYLADKGIEVYREYDPHAGTLYLDTEHMERVFVNLIMNAMDAMASGGELHLRVRMVPAGEWWAEHPPAQQTMPLAQEVVVIEVKDTGEGISPEIMERIFEPFFTVKAKGTGLGLAIVQRIVEEHGGQVSVQSEIGKGTTFTISLPRRV